MRGTTGPVRDRELARWLSKVILPRLAFKGIDITDRRHAASTSGTCTRLVTAAQVGVVKMLHQLSNARSLRDVGGRRRVKGTMDTRPRA